MNGTETLFSFCCSSACTSCPFSQLHHSFAHLTSNFPYGFADHYFVLSENKINSYAFKLLYNIIAYSNFLFARYPLCFCCTSLWTGWKWLSHPIIVEGSWKMCTTLMSRILLLTCRKNTSETCTDCKGRLTWFHLPNCHVMAQIYHFLSITMK